MNGNFGVTFNYDFMKKVKIYFPNLNGLRFIAAVLVIIHHIEQIKGIFNMDNYYGTISFVTEIGRLGVILFFVLSGFLITYLLLKEEELFKSVNIRKFYMRRILRIWPLYFLILIITFLVLPVIEYFNWPGYTEALSSHNLLLIFVFYVAFLPNLVLPLFGVVPYASHTWSIGAEE